MLNKEVKTIVNEYLGMVNNKNNFEAHENFWKTYEDEKAKKFKGLFKDELIIEKEVSIVKERRDIETDLSDANMWEQIKECLDPEIKEIVSHYRPYKYDEPRDSENNRVWNLFNAVTSIYCNYDLSFGEVRSNWEVYNPITGKELKIQRGSKPMRVLKNFCSDPKKLDAVQTKYSQILNTKTFKGVLCLSIHPLDYLTASVNDCGWTSCYNTLDKGEWCASTLSLITSPNTMIAYLKSSKDADYHGVTWNSKRWRAYVTLNEDNHLINIGRNYPYESENLMFATRDMINGLVGREFKNYKKYSERVEIYTPENMYNDCQEEDLFTFATDAWEILEGVNPKEQIEISPVGAICPECGKPYSDNEFDIVCSSCYDGDRCICCGEPVGRDGSWIESEQGYVCESCYENHYCYCDHCDEIAPSEAVEEVGYELRPDGGERTWYGRTNYYYFETWCDCCIEEALKAKKIIRCPKCHGLVPEEGYNHGQDCCKNCTVLLDNNKKL